ncbi:MAG: hypothetical protein ACOZQL_10945 [Myxococcota bacterium]
MLEVRYPARPSLDAWAQYEVEVRAAILELAKKGAWECLVDQTALKALAPDFPPRIAEINHWAREHGMQRTARLVSDSAVGELQTQRILKEGGVKDMGAVFHERAEAWRFLTSKG